MLFNYLKVGLRNILKYKVFSFINLFGLALAMSVSMLLIVMLVDQRSYDRFHIKKDRIYRILTNDPNSPFPYASTPLPLAPLLSAEYAIVEKSTHLVRGVGGDVTYNEKTFEMRGFFSDPSFFKVFSFQLEKGNPDEALVAPNSVVITKSLALKLFGMDEPLGKTVEFVDRGLHYLGGYRNEPPPVPWGTFKITGVIADADLKSHLKFDALVSASSMQALVADKKLHDLTVNWQNFYESFTYVLLVPGTQAEQLSAALEQVSTRYYSDSENLRGLKLIEQKLTSITPGRFTANPTRFSLPSTGYYVLAVLAFLILLSACLNYINLSIARAITRAREIGIRKVTGAGRKAVIFQFLSESIIHVCLSMSLAIVLLFLIRNGFSKLWINEHLNFDLRAMPAVWVMFAVFALVLGFIAGAYPAFYLSGVQPIQALKYNLPLGSGKLGIRKVLSISQFTLSFFFIATSILIFNQFKHFLEFEYGFASRNIVNIPVQGNDYRKVVTELSSVPGVSGISACDIVPSTGISGGTRLRSAGSEVDYTYLGELRTDENFIQNLEIRLVAGSNLPAASASSNRFILVNEAAVKDLGFRNPRDILGQVFEEEGTRDQVEVIGVTADFRFRLLVEQEKIGPLVLRNNSNFNFVNVKIGSSDLTGTVKRLEEKWMDIDHIHSFKYEFFDNQLANTHRAIFDVVTVLGFVSSLAVTIACLGLLGMSMYTVERRRKEVGVRKILGAGEITLALLLSKEFLSVLALAILIGGPMSYFGNMLWLQKFPNRVDFGMGSIFLAAAILLVLGLVTVGYQTIRASRTNPVDSLRAID